LLHLPVLYILGSIASDRNSLGFFLIALPLVFFSSYVFSLVTERNRKNVASAIKTLTARKKILAG
jgi:peptidoglycan/LPS O-acetylase OafA/YrhL